MAKFEVVCSNVGTVYSGDNEQDANRTFEECKQMSVSNYGRFSGESVTMFHASEIVREYIGTVED